MDVKDVLDRLERSQIFRAWSHAHHDAYLAHLFCMIDGEDRIWQAGYAHEGLITVFVVGAAIEALPADKPFHKPGTCIQELDMAHVRIGLDAALDAAAELQEKEYPSDVPLKTIAILQTIDGRIVYNITYVTRSFKTINIRVAADDGSIVSDLLVSLFSVDAGTPK